jgi:HEAT repeat protein
MPLFGGPPNIEKLEAKRDVKGLVKALEYQCGKDFARDFSGSFEAQRIREGAAAALASLGDSRAVEPLIAAMGDANEYVRKSAAEALGRIGDPRAIPSLLAAMADSDEGTHNAAVGALSILPWEPDGANGAAYWIALGEWDKCAQIGVPAIEPLLAAFKDAKWSSGTPVYEPSKKRAAAGALTQIGAPAIEPILAALVPLGSYTRQALADVLVQIGAATVEPLIAALEDSDSGVRSDAVWALGRLGDPRAVEPLIAALREGGFGMGLDAARALGRLGDRRAVEPLIVALDDEAQNRHLRQAAAEALGELGDQRAVKPLLSALNGGDEDLREAASKALGQIAWEPGNDAIGVAYWIARGEYGECIKIGAPAIEPLIGLLDSDHSAATRQTAAGALVAIYRTGRIGPEQQARILAQRNTITAEHSDELLGCWITAHSDYGVGVEFPV